MMDGNDFARRVADNALTLARDARVRILASDLAQMVGDTPEDMRDLDAEVAKARDLLEALGLGWCP
jgi:hypothetical protein